jgi:hypothetical protein
VPASLHQSGCATPHKREPTACTYWRGFLPEHEATNDSIRVAVAVGWRSLAWASVLVSLVWWVGGGEQAEASTSTVMANLGGLEVRYGKSDFVGTPGGSHKRNLTWLEVLVTPDRSLLVGPV